MLSTVRAKHSAKLVLSRKRLVVRIKNADAHCFISMVAQGQEVGVNRGSALLLSAK